MHRDNLTRAALRLAAVVLVAAIAGAVAQGCPAPRLPVVEGCRVGSSMCRNDTPHVCSASGRYHATGDLTCAASGAVCVEGDAGVAHCALATDGGAP